VNTPQVLAQSNLVLQGYIDDALNNDTYGADQNYTLATAAVLGSYAQVQQKMIAVDVFNLTNYFLTHPENNITSNLTVFQEVCAASDALKKTAASTSTAGRLANLLVITVLWHAPCLHLMIVFAGVYDGLVFQVG